MIVIVRHFDVLFHVRWTVDNFTEYVNAVAAMYLEVLMVLVKVFRVSLKCNLVFIELVFNL